MECFVKKNHRKELHVFFKEKNITWHHDLIPNPLFVDLWKCHFPIFLRLWHSRADAGQKHRTLLIQFQTQKHPVIAAMCCPNILKCFGKKIHPGMLRLYIHDNLMTQCWFINDEFEIPRSFMKINQSSVMPCWLAAVKMAPCFLKTVVDIPHLPTIDSLQGTNIPHHWKRKIILKDGLDRNRFVSSRVTLWLQDFVDVARYTTLEESFGPWINRCCEQLHLLWLGSN